MATKILLIEDDPILCETAKDFFESEGFEIHTASDGAEGIQMAFSLSPDIIVCDIAMPKMDGIAVFNTLKEVSSTSFIPFIFLTAKADIDEIRTGMELGADDYITKPFEYKRLLASIEVRLKKFQKFQQMVDEKFEAIADNIHTGVYVLYNDHLVVANQKLMKLSGFNESNFRNIPFNQMIGGDSSNNIENEIQRCLRGLVQKIRVDFLLKTKSGEQIPVSMFGKRIKWEKEFAIIGTIIEKPLAEEENNEDEKPEKPPKVDIKFSKREKEVLKLMCQGVSNKEIAEKLFISARTVEGHKASLLHKTNTKNSSEMILFVIKNKLIKI